MTELGYEVPVVGEKHQASDQRVSTALTEIKTVLNGRLTAGNFPAEVITPKKFAKQGKWQLVRPVGEQAEWEFPAEGFIRSVIVSPTIPVFAGNNEVQVSVGTTQIAATGPPQNKKETLTVGPFRVPTNEAWSIKSVAAGFVFPLIYAWFTEEAKP